MKNRVLKTLGIGAVCAMSALTLFGCGQPAETATDDTQDIELSSENDNPNFTSDDYETYLSEDGTGATVIEDSNDSSDSDATGNLDANVIDITGTDDDISTNVFETTPTTTTEDSASAGDGLSVDVTSSNPE